MTSKEKQKESQKMKNATLWVKLKEFIAWGRDTYPKTFHKLTRDDLRFMKKVGDKVTNETLYHFETLNNDKPLERESKTIFNLVLHLYSTERWDAKGIACFVAGYMDLKNEKDESMFIETFEPLVKEMIGEYERTLEEGVR